MKTRPYPSQLSRFGGFAAFFMSLMPCAENCAQDVRAPQPPVASTAAAPPPNLAACSPDGEYSAVAMPDGRIKCGNTKVGARRHTLRLCAPRVLVFSPDCRFLAAAGAACG